MCSDVWRVSRPRYDQQGGNLPTSTANVPSYATLGFCLQLHRESPSDSDYRTTQHLNIRHAEAAQVARLITKAPTQNTSELLTCLKQIGSPVLGLLCNRKLASDHKRIEHFLPFARGFPNIQKRQCLVDDLPAGLVGFYWWPSEPPKDVYLCCSANVIDLIRENRDRGIRVPMKPKGRPRRLPIF